MLISSFLNDLLLQFKLIPMKQLIFLAEILGVISKQLQPRQLTNDDLGILKYFHKYDNNQEGVELWEEVRALFTGHAQINQAQSQAENASFKVSNEADPDYTSSFPSFYMYDLDGTLKNPGGATDPFFYQFDNHPKVRTLKFLDISNSEHSTIGYWILTFQYLGPQLVTDDTRRVKLQVINPCRSQTITWEDDPDPDYMNEYVLGDPYSHFTSDPVDQAAILNRFPLFFSPFMTISLSADHQADSEIHEMWPNSDPCTDFIAEITETSFESDTVSCSLEAAGDCSDAIKDARPQLLQNSATQWIIQFSTTSSTPLGLYTISISFRLDESPNPDNGNQIATFPFAQKIMNFEVDASCSFSSAELNDPTDGSCFACALQYSYGLTTEYTQRRRTGMSPLTWVLGGSGNNSMTVKTLQGNDYASDCEEIKYGVSLVSITDTAAGEEPDQPDNEGMMGGLNDEVETTSVNRPVIYDFSSKTLTFSPSSDDVTGTYRYSFTAYVGGTLVHTFADLHFEVHEALTEEDYKLIMVNSNIDKLEFCEISKLMFGFEHCGMSGTPFFEIEVKVVQNEDVDYVPPVNQESKLFEAFTLKEDNQFTIQWEDNTYSEGFSGEWTVTHTLVKEDGTRYTSDTGVMSYKLIFLQPCRERTYVVNTSPDNPMDDKHDISFAMGWDYFNDIVPEPTPLSDYFSIVNGEFSDQFDAASGDCTASDWRLDEVLVTHCKQSDKEEWNNDSHSDNCQTDQFQYQQENWVVRNLPNDIFTLSFQPASEYTTPTQGVYQAQLTWTAHSVFTFEGPKVQTQPHVFSMKVDRCIPHVTWQNPLPGQTIQDDTSVSQVGVQGDEEITYTLTRKVGGINEEVDNLARSDSLTAQIEQCPTNYGFQLIFQYYYDINSEEMFMLGEQQGGPSKYMLTEPIEMNNPVTWSILDDSGPGETTIIKFHPRTVDDAGLYTYLLEYYPDMERNYIHQGVQLMHFTVQVEPEPEPELEPEPYLLLNDFESNQVYNLDVEEHKVIELGQLSSSFPTDDIEVKVYLWNTQVSACPTDDCPVTFDQGNNRINLIASKEVFENNIWWTTQTILDETDEDITILQNINLKVNILLKYRSQIETWYSFDSVLSYKYVEVKEISINVPTDDSPAIESGSVETESEAAPASESNDSGGTDSGSADSGSADSGSADSGSADSGDTDSAGTSAEGMDKNMSNTPSDQIDETNNVVDIEDLSEEQIEETTAVIEELRTISDVNDLRAAIVSVVSQEVIIDSNVEANVVAEVNEDTNFEKAAEFDFFTWCSLNGIRNGVEGEVEAEIPLVYAQKSLEDYYSVPYKESVDRYGNIGIGFSSPLEEISFNNIFLRLNYAGMYSEERLRHLDQSQLNSEETESGEDKEETHVEQQELNELEMIQELLKATNSVALELVSGNAINVDEKGYDWNLIEFTENNLEIEVAFTNPEVISYDKTDTFMIKFQNTPVFLIPTEDELAPIPNGYKLAIPLPVQKSPLDTNETEKIVKQQLTGLIITNLIVSFVFKFSLQELLGMINALQVIAHLPLNNIPLPVNAYFIFDVLVKVVSFDIFPIHEYFDMKFTPTEPWSQSFEWLDYGSVNFIESMGSATILLVCMMVYMLVIFVVTNIKKCKGRDKNDTSSVEKQELGESRTEIPDTTRPLQEQNLAQQFEEGENQSSQEATEEAMNNTVKQTPNCFKLFIKNSKQRMHEKISDIIKPITCIHFTLTILIESFLELLICSSTSMRMFSIRDFWNVADKISIALQFMTLFLLTGFVIILVKFTFCEARNLSIVNKAKRNEQFQEVLDDTRNHQKEREKQRLGRGGGREYRKLVSLKYSQMINSAKRRDQAVKQKADEIEEERFTVFRPLFTAPGSNHDESLKIYSFRAMLYVDILIVRRIVLLYVAMFLDSLAFVQVIIFMTMSLLNVFYTVQVMPHIQKSQNVMEYLSELCILICGYLAMTLVGMNYSQEMSDATGNFMTQMLRLMLAINVAYILYGFLKQIKLRIRKFRNQLAAKVAQQKRQLRMQQKSLELLKKRSSTRGQFSASGISLPESLRADFVPGTCKLESNPMHSSSSSMFESLQEVQEAQEDEEEKKGSLSISELSEDFMQVFSKQARPRGAPQVSAVQSEINTPQSTHRFSLDGGFSKGKDQANKSSKWITSLLDNTEEMKVGQIKKITQVDNKGEIKKMSTIKRMLIISDEEADDRDRFDPFDPKELLAELEVVKQNNDRLEREEESKTVKKVPYIVSEEVDNDDIEFQTIPRGIPTYRERNQDGFEATEMKLTLEMTYKKRFNSSSRGSSSRMSQRAESPRQGEQRQEWQTFF